MPSGRRNAARRRRGEGGINFNRDKGLWVASVAVGLDETGRTLRRYVYAKRREDLLDKLDALKSEKREGTLTKPTRTRLAKYLNAWLEDTARPNVRYGTFRNYSGLIKNKILPQIGGFRLSDLAALHVQNLFSELKRFGESSYRLQQVHAVLYSALAEAVRLRLIPFNVCAAVRTPRLPDKEMHVLNQIQAAKLLEKARGDRFFALYVLALATGMRQGELFGLKWHDVDLKAGTLSIQRTVAREEVKTAEGRRAVRVGTNAPKTKKGRRLIALPASVLPVLRDHKKRMMKEGHLEWVFCNTRGGLLDRGRFRVRKWLPLLEKTNDALPTNQKLPARFRFHDLRHTAATFRMLQGDNPKVVQELLGHARVAITSDLYSHVLPSMQERSAERFDKTLSRLVK